MNKDPYVIDLDQMFEEKLGGFDYKPPLPELLAMFPLNSNRWPYKSYSTEAEGLHDITLVCLPDGQRVMMSYGSLGVDYATEEEWVYYRTMFFIDLKLQLLLEAGINTYVVCE